MMTSTVANTHGARRLRLIWPMYARTDARPKRTQVHVSLLAFSQLDGKRTNVGAGIDNQPAGACRGASIVVALRADVQDGSRHAKDVVPVALRRNLRLSVDFQVERLESLLAAEGRSAACRSRRLLAAHPRHSRRTGCQLVLPEPTRRQRLPMLAVRLLIR